MAVVSFPSAGGSKGRAPRSAEIRQELKRMIMLGEVPPGAPLLELDIASQFKCSQGSVREALLALQDEGLVIRLPHRGTRVSDCTEAEAQEMFRLRHSIETRALARALPKIDATLLDTLKDLIRAMEKAAEDDDEYGVSELDRKFHRQLLAAADLPALDPILHRCLVHNQRFKITRSGAARDLVKTAQRHWSIITAIESGDRDAAVAAIGHHVATIVDPGPEVFPATEAGDVTDRDPVPRPTAEMQAIIDGLLRDDTDLPDQMMLAPEEGRAVAEYKNIRWQVDLPPMAEVRDLVLPGDAALATGRRDAILFRPEPAGAGAILYAHGGGFAFCSNRTHERFMRALAAETGRPVIGVDYRLAPENPFPAGLLDMVSAWRAISRDPRAFGIDDGPILIAGDSAGANLALATMLHEVAAGLPLPAGGLLYYGTYATDFGTRSYRDHGDGPGLTAAATRRYWDWYAPDPATRSDVLATPLGASDEMLRKLPPLHLLAAEVDPLACDTYALKARLDRLGRDDPMHVEPGVIHGFLQMTWQLAAARNAVAIAATAAKRLFEQVSQKTGGN